MVGFVLVLTALIAGVESELSRNSSGETNGENETWNELEIERPRLRHKDQSFLLDRYPVGELPTDSENCRRSAKCINISNGTLCMGTKLPYSTTTLDLLPESMSVENIQVFKMLYNNEALNNFYA